MDDRFIITGPQPAYIAPGVQQSLPERRAWAEAELRCCRACPRDCAVDRAAAELGTCGIGSDARVASAFAHFGEEDCLRGTRGSGTIFFAGCNLRCVFCQNWDISQRPTGREVAPAELADLMLSLQDVGCHNVNLVSPAHVIPQIVLALSTAIERGLRLPVVYNTGAYDTLDSLRRLEGLIDIYMPDFKFWDPDNAARYCHAPDYPDRARDALREMHRQVGDLVTTADGVACRGLLVRHLVMPGGLAESAAIFEWLARELSPDTFINVMGQYRPEHEVGSAGHDELNRRPSGSEFADARDAARRSGLWRFAR